MAYTTLKKPSSYFNTKLYTGNGSTQSITGVNFQPDMVWIKSRSLANGHTVWDNIRGVTNWLTPNNSNAEGTYSGGLTSFDSDGFSIGDGGDINTSSATQVAWNWLASNTTESNTDGSITSTVSANTTSGFSIVSYTGTGSAGSFGHGLSTPDIVLIKDRTDNGNSWYFHTTVIDGSQDYLTLENTNAKSDAASGYSIGTSVFNIGGGGSWVNVSSKNYVAYCFKEVKGFSKFGSYVGNGNADGTFVYTGFKPAFVIQKNASAVQGWQLQDNKRLGYNPNNYLLQPHDSAAESALQRIDLLSNGFKVRTTDAGQNASGNTYIYMAFAEEPLVGDNPATAR